MRRENNSYYATRISLLRTSLARDVLYFDLFKEVNRDEMTISRGVSGSIQEHPFFYDPVETLKVGLNQHGYQRMASRSVSKRADRIREGEAGSCYWL
jgi:hypothetical protein